MWRAMALVCAASLCVLGAEWRSLGAPVVVSTGLPVRSQAPPARPAASGPSDDLDAQVASVLERPLFSRTRRPTIAVDGRVAVKDPGLPRLSGLVMLPGFRRAIFQAPGPGKPVVTVVGEAGRIDDWTVASIEGDGVTLTRGDESMRLAPAFAPVGNAPPPPPPRPLSRWEAPADHGILRARWSNPQLQP